jgi:hemolysin activation/secretion protein
VRAYPANEAGGSQAHLLNLEYQQLVPVAGQNLTVAGFYDWGDVTINKFSSFTTDLNHYQLEGWGLWMGSSVSSGLGQTDFKLTWARRIGHNPKASSSGLDQDGSLVLNRYLFNINHAF